VLLGVLGRGYRGEKRHYDTNTEINTGQLQEVEGRGEKLKKREIADARGYQKKQDG